MKKIISLIKASMTSGMSIFKVNLKNKSKTSKILIIVFLCFALMTGIGSYVCAVLEQLKPFNMQYVCLSIFVLFISFMTLIEGIYKSGNLLYNCKDDQLLFSLPIDKKAILFIRMFKFYVFELAFNSLFLIPLIVCYAFYTKVGISFYITSIFMILLLPIIPIVLSCIIGTIISWLSSKFRFKNIAQTIIAVIFILGVFYLSFNVDKFLNKLATNAKSINDIITKLYYPAGAYANLAIDFKIQDLLLFVFINVIVAIMSIFLLSKVYFKTNSKLQSVKVGKKKKVKNNVIKNRGQIRALIRKEFNIFFQTPVFIINSGMGIFMFLAFIVMIMFKYNSVLGMLASSGVDVAYIPNNIPLFIVMVIAIGSFTTSITSSMISLEGRRYTILRSLPISSKRILLSKVYTASLLTVPAFLVGDILLFIKFKPSFIIMILLLILTVLMPLVSHFTGLIINLKFPKLEYDSPTEVVKQSVSAFAAVMLDFIILIALVYGLMKLMDHSVLLILSLLTLLFAIIDIILYIYLAKRGTKIFNELTV